MKNLSLINLFQALFMAVLALSSIQVRADYSADLFEQGSNQKKKLYTLEVKSVMEGEVENATATFKDPSGEVVFEEKAKLKGPELVKTEISQNQLKVTAIVSVGEKEITFTKTADGKTKTSTEKREGLLASSANFQKFVKEHWADLAAGKTLDFRYAVWDRMETVGFSLFKTSEEDLKGQKVLVLKMKPSSFIISALVKPIFFKYLADGSRLLEMNGRVAPKLKNGDSWKDLDSEVIYSYPN